VPEGVAEEIQRRVEALTADMKPMSPAGVILIAQMATCSVRMELAAEHESASTARNVRHAADDFDEEQRDQADQHYEAIGENPRLHLRKLRKTPQGVARLCDAWQDLRADLTIDPKPIWTAAHLEEAGHLIGLKSEHARGSRMGALSRGFWGDFGGLTAQDGGDLDEAARQAWAKAALIERIDAEIAELEAHYLTLDFERIELDRAGAGARALFDISKKACLARRYASEASRGFFKALKEFRQVEAESAAPTEAAPTHPSPAKMGSSCQTSAPLDREPARVLPDAPSPTIPVVPAPENRRSRRARLAKLRR
jgi:hypothetical protein